MKADTDWLLSVMATMPGAVNVAGRSQVFVAKAEYPEPDQKAELTYPYWVVFPAKGRNTSPAVTGPNVTRHPRFTIWSVGKSFNSTVTASDNLEAVLTPGGRGLIPNLEGEKSERLWYSAPLPVQLDTTKSPPLVYHVAEIGYDSQVV